MTEGDPCIATDDIQKAYEQDNIRLIKENKELREQLEKGDSGLKRANTDLRKKIIELENTIQMLNENQNRYKEFRENELNLKERISELEIENDQLRRQLGEKDGKKKGSEIPVKQRNEIWDPEETQNEAIKKLINDLRIAYKKKSGTAEALESLVAIVDPNCIVTCGGSGENAELEALRAEVKRLKEEKAVPKKPRNSFTPRAAVGAQSAKMKELQEQVDSMTKKIEETQKELSQSRNRNKEHLKKNKELQTIIDQNQSDVNELKRAHQLELTDYIVKQKTLEAEVKALQSNADYRKECEELRFKNKTLENEISELKKPKFTGDPTSDRVLDKISNLESEIHARTRDLNKVIENLNQAWEDEKEELDKRNRQLENENSELTQNVAMFKKAFVQMQEEISRLKDHRPTYK